AAGPGNPRRRRSGRRWPRGGGGRGGGRNPGRGPAPAPRPPPPGGGSRRGPGGRPAPPPPRAGAPGGAPSSPPACVAWRCGTRPRALSEGPGGVHPTEKRLRCPRAPAAVPARGTEETGARGGTKSVLRELIGKPGGVRRLYVGNEGRPPACEGRQTAAPGRG